MSLWPEAQIVLNIIIAALLGIILGLERTMASKHAGMRTYGLVSMGSALFVTIGTMASFQFSLFTGINPLQLAGFVVVGIGFIGSGLAAVGNNHPELTTAAGLWLAAGVGIAAGFGYYTLAFVSTILAILIFSLVLRIENSLRRRFKAEIE